MLRHSYIYIILQLQPWHSCVATCEVKSAIIVKIEGAGPWKKLMKSLIPKELQQHPQQLSHILVICLQIITYKEILFSSFFRATLSLQKVFEKLKLPTKWMFAARNISILFKGPQTFYVSDGPSKTTRDKTTYIVYVSK